MEDFEKAIKAHNLKRQAGIINQFSDDLEKAGGPKSYPIGTVRNGRKKMAEGKWVPVKGEKKSKPAEKPKSSNKVADPLSGKSGAELSSEQKARILNSHIGDTKVQTEKYLSDPKYVFSMRTSQFGNERLYIVNKETGKPSFIGAGTVPSSGPAMGIPSTGFESKFAMEKVMNKEK